MANPKLSRVLLSLCLLPLAACEPEGPANNEEAGDDTSGETDDTGPTGETGEDASGSCGMETVTVLTDLSQVPAGFDVSAADIIAGAEGSYAGTFTWSENDGPVTVTHAGTSSPLSMSVDHGSGEVRLVEVELAGQFPNGQDGGSLCANRIEFDADFTFATEDGVFAEASVIPVSVSAAPPDEGFASGPSIYWELDMNAVGGTLSLADFSFTDATVTAIVLMAQFADDAATGSLGMEILGNEGGPADGIAGFGIVASFDATLVP